MLGKAISLTVAIFILGHGLGGLAHGLDYPPGYAFAKVPDPLSGDNPKYSLLPLARPDPGQSFYDLRFGTVLTRATQTPGVRHEYSRFDPFNCNRSKILLMGLSGERLVYRTQTLPYDQPANLVRTITTLEETRWDRGNPDLIWGLRDFTIVTLDVETNLETVVKDFSQDATIGPILQAEPDLYRITTKEEGRVIPLAQVSLTNTHTGEEWSKAADNLGNFIIEGFEPGTYSLRIQAKGRQERVLKALTIDEDKDLGEIELIKA